MDCMNWCHSHWHILWNKNYLKQKGDRRKSNLKLKSFCESQILGIMLEVVAHLLNSNPKKEM